MRRRYVPVVAAAKRSPAKAIYNALVAWWDLNDNAASPTYTDLHAGNNMTLRDAAGSKNTNTQTGAALNGQGWNPAGADNAVCYVPRSNTALDLGNFDFSFGGWFKTRQDAATASFFMGRIGGNAGSYTKLRAWLFVEGADALIKARYSADGTTITQTVSSGVGPDAANWQFITLTYAASRGQLELRYRKVGGALISVSGAIGTAIHTGTTDANFTIGEGNENDGNPAGINRNGVATADECFMCNRAITDEDFNYMFNNGLGITYSRLKADAA